MFRMQFPVFCVGCYDLTPGKTLGGTAFVLVDVGGFRTDYGMIGLCQRLQTEDIGPGPVENKECLRIFSKYRPEHIRCPGRIFIFSIRKLVILIGVCKSP